MNTLILVVSKYRLLREILAQHLNACHAIRAINCETTEGSASCVHPDVVLYLATETADIVPGVDKLKALYPRTKFLLLLLIEDGAAAKAALGLKPAGLADGNASCSELVEIINNVAAGPFAIATQSTFGPDLMLASPEIASAHSPRGEKLTEREFEVLRLLADGSTNRDIATKLSLSEHTVRAHLRVVMQKLHVTNRVQAAAYVWQGNSTKRKQEDQKGWRF